MNSNGDALARGARSHTFGPPERKMTNAEWDALWANDGGAVLVVENEKEKKEDSNE